jgi:hypothetical protein
MNTRLLAATAPMAILLLSACNTNDPELGHAIRANAEAHVVDAQPVYAGLPVEGSDAVRLVEGQRRYLKGQVKDLLKVDGKSGIGTQGGASDASAAGTGRTSGAP